MSKGQKIPLDEAKAVASDFIQSNLSHYSVAEIVGSIARDKPTVGDIDILVVDENNPRRRTDIWYRHIHFNVWTCNSSNFEPAKLWLTGPREANIRRAQVSKSLGFHYNMYGVWDGETRVAGTIEGIEQLLGNRVQLEDVPSAAKVVTLSKRSGAYTQCLSCWIAPSTKEGHFDVTSRFELIVDGSVVKRKEKGKASKVSWDLALAVVDEWENGKIRQGYTSTERAAA